MSLGGGLRSRRDSRRVARKPVESCLISKRLGGRCRSRRDFQKHEAGFLTKGVFDKAGGRSRRDFQSDIGSVHLVNGLTCRVNSSL